MKIILCSAFYKEIAYIIEHFKAHRIYIHRNKYPCFKYTDEKNEIYFLISGMGHKNTVNHLEFFKKYFKWDNKYLWILTGYAGAVNNELKLGNIVVPSLVSSQEKSYNILLGKIFKHVEKYHLHTVPGIYNKKDKLMLKEQLSADIIDMEAAGFCEVLNKHHITNFFIFKAVTDTLNFKLPDPSLVKGSLRKVKLSDLLGHFWQIHRVLILYWAMDRASRSIFWFFSKFYETYKDR